MTAASSPTLGPTTTRGSRTGCLSKIACSVSARSLPIGRNCIAPSSIHRMPGAAAAGPASPVVECVPNVSEGRDRALIETLAAAIRAVPGVTLANVHADPDHHRSVVSFLGGPEAVEAAPPALAAPVVALLDMRNHRGIHPRVGALDVLPFVPLVGFTMDQTVALARRVGRAIGARHSLPVYYYGGVAPRPGRGAPPPPRPRGGDGAPPAPPPPARPPRGRPPRFDARSGAVLVGARDLLVAFNVWLTTDDVTAARQIARPGREASGGLPAVQAMGVPLASRGIAQVSMNLLDHRRTPIPVVFDRVVDEARRRRTGVGRSELVGLAPRAAFGGRTPESVGLENFTSELYLETYLEPDVRASG